MLRPTLHLLVLAAILAWIAIHDARLSPVQTAFAQDDDGGNDDGGADDDDDVGSSPAGDGDDDDAPQRRARQERRQPAPGEAPAAPAEPLPVRAESEVIALGLSDAELSEAIAQGFILIEARDVEILGRQSARLRVPEGQDLEAARAVLTTIAPASATDFNHYYRAEQSETAAGCEGPHCVAFDQIAWPASANLMTGCMPAPRPAAASPDGASAAAAMPKSLAAPGAIGMIDTGINPGHDTFAGADLDVVRLAPADLAPSRAQHGTAVASILVGSADSRTPGLVPGARLIAVDAFHRDGSDERSDAFSLISGLGLLAERGATVINLSLAGPPNEPVRETIAALRARGIAIVAAAGNGGPKSAPAFPAAYDGVIAVTAVDRNGNVYRRAAQGPYVDIAAPGVEVWAAASVRGARPKTGTSFAAPFVTAAAYVLLAADVPADQVEAQLAASATDLGEAGRDEVFGNGLLNLADLCGMSGG